MKFRPEFLHVETQHPEILLATVTQVYHVYSLTQFCERLNTRIQGVGENEPGLKTAAHFTRN